jgi:hypothetical protein
VELVDGERLVSIVEEGEAEEGEGGWGCEREGMSEGW